MTDRGENALIGLFLFAVFYTLYLAAPIVVPLVIATLLAFTLAPIVRTVENRLIRRSAAAAIVVSGFVGAVFALGATLGTPAADWAAKLPDRLRDMEAALYSAKAPLETLLDASSDVEAITQLGDGGSETLEVSIKRHVFLDAVLARTPQVAASMLATVFFVYFLLAAGPNIPAKFECSFPHWFAGTNLSDVGSRVEREISRYLLSITLINLSLGAVAAGWLAFYGVSNPILWGAVLALLNFAPYIGAIAGAAVLFCAAFFDLGSAVESLTVVGGYLALTILEGQLVTPTLVGNRLKISPTILFLGIIVFGWMWSVAGVLIAVPLLACMKIIGQRVSKLSVLDVLVSAEPSVPNHEDPKRRSVDSEVMC
ncbi:MAG: AI-2E family transporter [Pseudomonadota bacterium]